MKSKYRLQYILIIVGLIAIITSNFIDHKELTIFLLGFGIGSIFSNVIGIIVVRQFVVKRFQ